MLHLFRNLHQSSLMRNTAKIREFLSQRDLTHALSSLGLFSLQRGFKISRLLQLFYDVEATNELPTDVHLRISRPGMENGHEDNCKAGR